MIKKTNEKISITEEILISNLKDFYGDDENKKKNAFRQSVESWYKKSKMNRDNALLFAKGLNNLNNNPLTKEQKKLLGKRGVMNVEKHGFLPIAKIEISSI